MSQSDTAAFRAYLATSLAYATELKAKYERDMAMADNEIDAQYYRRMRAFYDGQVVALTAVINECKAMEGENYE